MRVSDDFWPSQVWEVSTTLGSLLRVERGGDLLLGVGIDAPAYVAGAWSLQGEAKWTRPLESSNVLWSARAAFVGGVAGAKRLSLDDGSELAIRRFHEPVLAIAATALGPAFRIGDDHRKPASATVVLDPESLATVWETDGGDDIAFHGEWLCTPSLARGELTVASLTARGWPPRVIRCEWPGWHCHSGSLVCHFTATERTAIDVETGAAVWRHAVSVAWHHRVRTALAGERRVFIQSDVGLCAIDLGSGDMRWARDDLHMGVSRGLEATGDVLWRATSYAVQRLDGRDGRTLGEYVADDAQVVGCCGIDERRVVVVTDRTLRCIEFP